MPLFRSSSSSNDSEFPLISPSSSSTSTATSKKKEKKKSIFASAALSRLRCASSSSSDASAPSPPAAAAAAAARSPRRRRPKPPPILHHHHHIHMRNISSTSNNQTVSMAVAGASDDNDDDDSFECFMRRHHPMVMSRAGRHDAERFHREIMKFETRMSGGLIIYDRYRDWRLDVDRMSYEELLELGDRIGYVSTGLREDEISQSLKKMEHSVFDASQLHKEIERKCSICQEEYEVNEDIGKLDCGHSYHTYCIKQWLLQKNTCPVCKTAVTKT